MRRYERGSRLVTERTTSVNPNKRIEAVVELIVESVDFNRHKTLGN